MYLDGPWQGDPGGGGVIVVVEDGGRVVDDVEENGGGQDVDENVRISPSNNMITMISPLLSSESKCHSEQFRMVSN